MNKKVLITTVVAILIILGIILISNSDNEAANVTTTEVSTETEPAVTENTDQTEESVNEAEINPEQTNAEVTPNSAGSYGAYSDAKVAAADGDIVVFFKASWCPPCQRLDADINDNLGSIPDDLTILTADFDTETDLRKKFGVSFQHTMVQIDSEGNVINKWSGSPTLAALAAEVS